MVEPVKILLLGRPQGEAQLLQGLLEESDLAPGMLLACGSLQEAESLLQAERVDLIIAEPALLQEMLSREAALSRILPSSYYLALLEMLTPRDVHAAQALEADDFMVLPLQSPELSARLAKGIKEVLCRRRQEKYAPFQQHSAAGIAREKEIPYLDILEKSNDGILIIQDSLLKYANPEIVRITGFPLEEIRGHPLGHFLQPAEAARLMNHCTRRLAGDNPPAPYEMAFQHKDGSSTIVEVNTGLTSYRGRPADMVFFSDITTQKETEKALRKSEERYREILERIQEGYYEADLQGNVIFCNEAACRLLGYSLQEIIGMNFQQLYKDPAKVFKVFNQVFQTGKPNRGFALEMFTKDGSIRYGELSVSLMKDEKGRVVGFRGLGRDVTERKKAEEKIRYLSFYDKLTGLHNRAFFEEEIRRLDTERQLPLSIVIADANGLKLVNDAFGHQVGDKLLVKIAELLRYSCRKEDLICRWGGDEFAVLLPKASPVLAQALLERFQEACRKADPEPITLSLALGTATKEDRFQDIFNVVKKAETNMYKDKMHKAKSFRHTVIATLVHKLGEKDYETEEHTWRMQGLAVELGSELGLNEKMMDELTLAVTLHDIGKLAVPESILMKPARLTAEEWELVKEHSERGYRIALTSAELASVAPLILAHHERWDGNGYPHGLKGEEIPLLSRIISVIDAYDVMTNGRPYKGKVSHELAMEELRKCAGRQFDPRIVEAFIRLNSGFETGFNR